MEKYNVFISYKRIDKDRVFKIKNLIETKVTAVKCWIDIDGIESDAQFANVIINAINNTQVFLFMYSNAHSKIEDYERDWTVREISFAQKKRKRIVFINIDKTPLTDWFELFFGTKQQIDALSDLAMTKLCDDITIWLKKEEVNVKYNVVLKSTGSQRIEVIKTISELTKLNIVEAMAVVNEAPVVIRECVNKEDALLIQSTLKKIGSTVEIRSTENGRYNVLLKSVVSQRVQIIKIIKKITGLSLKESKELVDKHPSIIRNNVCHSLAVSCKLSLEKYGALVTITPSGYGTINGHMYVDLGLPSGLKWAASNIGTSEENEYSYGLWYAWGEAEFKMLGEERKIAICDILRKDIGCDSRYDVAKKAFGSSWRLPTCEECQELIDQCTWLWTDKNHVRGCLVTGPNGNSIFLPAGGFYDSSGVTKVNIVGSWWTSTPNKNSNGVYYLYISEEGGNHVYEGSPFDIGRNIRPVSI